MKRVVVAAAVAAVAAAAAATAAAAAAAAVAAAATGRRRRRRRPLVVCLGPGHLGRGESGDFGRRIDARAGSTGARFSLQRAVRKGRGGGKGTPPSIVRGDAPGHSVLPSAELEHAMNRFAVGLLNSALLALGGIGIAGCRCCAPCVEGLPPSAPVATSVSVLVEVAVFQADDDASAAAVGLSTGAGDPRFRVMSAEESTAFAADWSSSRGVTLLQMPSVVTRSGEEVTIHVGETPEPVSKGIVNERGGLEFSVEERDWTGTRARLVPTYDGATITLDLSMERRDDAPVGRAAIPASEISIRVPDLKLRSGETALIASAADGRSGQRRIFATVRSTILSDAAGLVESTRHAASMNGGRQISSGTVYGFVGFTMVGADAMQPYAATAPSTIASRKRFR